MNFPLQYPIFQFFYWLVDTAGLGGIVIGLIGGGFTLIYGLTVYWISRGGNSDADTFAYPTPALHGEHAHPQEAGQSHSDLRRDVRE